MGHNIGSSLADGSGSMSRDTGVKIADGIQLSEGPSGTGGSTSKVARWLTTKLARQLVLGAKSQRLSLWISPQHCLSFSQRGGWIPPERDPIDQGKSRNGIHDLVSEITLSPAQCSWSQTPALSRRGRREDMSMVRTIRVVLEASYHNMPSQSIAGQDRYPVPSTGNYPSPNPNGGLAIVSQCLPFLWYSASLFQINFTKFLPPK